MLKNDPDDSVGHEVIVDAVIGIAPKKHENRQEVYQVVIGAILIQLTLGVPYTFGNMGPYSKLIHHSIRLSLYAFGYSIEFNINNFFSRQLRNSFFKCHPDSVCHLFFVTLPLVISYMRNVLHMECRHEDFSYILSAALSGQAIGIVTGSIMETTMGPRITVYFGGAILTIAGVVSSFILDSYIGFILTYGGLFGLGTGICYTGTHLYIRTYLSISTVQFIKSTDNHRGIVIVFQICICVVDFLQPRYPAV